MTTSYEGVETLEADTFMGPRRYRISYQCARCGHGFQRTLRAVPKNDPPCPRPTCALEAQLAQTQREKERLEAMLQEQRAPAHIGDKTVVRAVDETARIVMEDYNMTDLKDNVRAGDSVAPKLETVEKQRAADNYFGPKGGIPIIGPTGGRRTVPAKQMDQLGRRAIAGAFRGMAVSPAQIMPDAVRGAPPLRQVGMRTNDMAKPTAK